MEAVLERLFLKVLNMSLTGSFVILAVLLTRLLLRKAPRRFSYWLWGAVGFRLICPVSFGASFSLLGLLPQRLPQQSHGLGTAMTYIPEHIGLMQQPRIQVGIPGISEALSQSLPAPVEPGASVNPMQIVTFVAMALWLVGLVVCLVCGLVSHCRLVGKLEKAVHVRGNLWECDTVRCPFILGWFRPRVYVPFGLTGDARQYVLAHEACHIRKKDHLVKLLAYGILSVHWFNPLCHVAFRLMERDMEMRCDEEVLRQNPGIAKVYSLSLLSLASNRRLVSPSPLAFGETGVKGRIQHVLAWKKPKLWQVVLSVLLCAGVLLACTANPARPGQDADPTTPGETQSGETWGSPSSPPENPTEPQITTEPPVPEPSGSNLMGEFESQEEAISAAILNLGPGSGKTFDYRCESHMVLSEAIACGKAEEGWCGYSAFCLVVLYQEFDLSQGGIRTVTENLSLMKVTVDSYSDGSYGLNSWYHPANPGEPALSEEEVFPAFVLQKDLNQYLLPLKQACYEKAVRWGKWDGMTDKVIPLDTTPILENLLQTLMSSPLSASNPGAYIQAHPQTYQELLYYGTFTLQYIYDEFLKGGQTGLEGHILRFLMDDLTGLPLESRLYQEQGAPWTGQSYFDLWAATMEETYGHVDEATLEQEQYPVWLLFRHMRER